ncbi:N-6 DNA methylase [Streptomyces albogriseolus]|uniref:N-6 DNA methylase n=1 Tax=Streptomyces albogriseolus TaxID=1887 RepID=UPI00363BC78A
MSWKRPAAPGPEPTPVPSHAPVSLGEIKELAGVGRPTVSNWRRRFSREVVGGPGDSRLPFPDPLTDAGSESKPLFDAAEIADWLDLRTVPDAEPDDDGHLETYGDRFRRALRLRGLIALKHRLGSAETLISQALAVIAMSAEGKDWITEALPSELLAEYKAAGPDVVRAAQDLMNEIGAPGWAADALLGLDDVGLEIAKRLESDLVMDITPREVVALVAALIGPTKGGPDQRSTISLCAGLGELLLGMSGGPYEGLRGHGELVAVEPDPLLRKLLRYRLLSYEAGAADVCASPSDLDTPRAWNKAPVEPHDFSTADLVLADPPYVSGERERDAEGPLWWALEAVRRLRPEGRAYVVVPTWTLTRTSGTGPASVRTPTISTREALLDKGCVEAIVQLPRRIHPFRTGAEYALLVLRPPSPEPRSVLLVDADRIAQRADGKSETWIEQVVGLTRPGAVPEPGEERPKNADAYDPQDAQRFNVRASGPGREQLLDNRSILPAHRLAAPEAHVDHFEETLTARRAVAAALPRLRDWVGDMDISLRDRNTPVRHRKLDVFLKAGQLKLLNGHRIETGDIGEAGLPVVGRAEMLGELPIGVRRILPEALAAYTSAKRTEAGDVLLLAEHGVRCLADMVGGCVLLSPVRGLRIKAYQEHVRNVAQGGPVRPDALWMRPHSLARLLQAPRNQHRGSGSLVRRVSVRDMDLPQLPPEEIAELEAVLAETERLRADVRRQLEALDRLAERISAGVADGGLALRRQLQG